MSIFTGRTRWAVPVVGAAAIITAGAWLLLRPASEIAIATCEGVGPHYVELPGGAFLMGSNDFYPDERPIRQVEAPAISIRGTEVTNAEYAAFVEATGYLTVAERPAPETGEPGSAVFIAPGRDQPVRPLSWWHWVDGASWRAPEGPGSSIETRMDHPVVHIAYEDAIAFANWEGTRLPREEEWEYAASAGGTTTVTPYRLEGGQEVPIANTWQGFFPIFNQGDDGYIGSSPSGCFEANAFGVYDMIGNVWEWVETPDEAPVGTIKGGSFLCAPNYCMRYRPAAREAQETGLGTNHIGFRTIRKASNESWSMATWP